MPGIRHNQRAKKMKQKKRDRAALLDAQKLQVDSAKDEEEKSIF